MQPKASNNDTKLSTIFRFLLPLFSIHWVLINLWLFSRGLTKLLWQLLLVFWSVCGGMRTWTSILCHITEITLKLYLYRDFFSADCELLEGRNLVVWGFFALFCFLYFASAGCNLAKCVYWFLYFLIKILIKLLRIVYIHRHTVYK